MNKKIPLGAAIAFMAVVAGITFCITMMVSLAHFNTKVLEVKEREDTYKRLADVDGECRQNFDGEIDEDNLNDSTAAGYISGLGDKYSRYMTKNEYETYLLEKNGKLVSIGISIQKDSNGYIIITGIEQNSPAAGAGMQEGDIIISVNGEELKSKSLSDAERILKGEIGTKIDVVYRRNGADTSKTIQRKAYDQKYVTYKTIGTNGYIKVASFSEKTGGQFNSAIDSLMNSGVKSLIIDLRNCSSGDSLYSANTVLDRLLPKGTIGSTVKAKSGEKISVATSDQNDLDAAIVVLVNGKTAGIAEYFAAAIVDFDKGTLVGTQTYGKSALQSVIPLTDGSAINLTTSHFLTSKGQNIAGVGLKPTYEVIVTNTVGTAGVVEDKQLAKALEVANSKTSGSTTSSQTASVADSSESASSQTTSAAD